MPFVKLVTSGILFSFLFSCKTIQPEIPQNTSPLDRVEIEKPVSYINVPIKINLSPYFKETENSLEKKFSGSEQNCAGVSFSYNFHRDPIKFQGAGKTLEFSVDGQYSLKLNYCPQCTDLFSSKPSCIIPRIYTSCGINEQMPKIQVSYSTKIGVGENYHLSSVTKLKEIESKTPCEITVFNYNATNTIEKEISNSLRALERKIDKELSSIDLKPEIIKTWNTISTPTELNGFGFLHLNPTALSFSDIQFKGESAFINAILITQPEIYFDNRVAQSIPLPKPKPYKELNGFNITTDVHADYDSLSRLITKSLQGKKVDVKGKKIIFEEIQLFGIDEDKINIAVTFNGNKKGTLYLSGAPVFNPSNQTIYFTDLHFDIKTKSVLLKSAKWLLNDKITSSLSDLSQIEFTPYFELIKTSIDKTLNTEISPNVYLSGSIEQISVREIYPLQNKLFIRVNTTGNLKIAM